MATPLAILRFYRLYLQQNIHIHTYEGLSMELLMAKLADVLMGIRHQQGTKPESGKIVNCFRSCSCS